VPRSVKYLGAVRADGHCLQGVDSLGLLRQQLGDALSYLFTPLTMLFPLNCAPLATIHDEPYFSLFFNERRPQLGIWRPEKQTTRGVSPIAATSGRPYAMLQRNLLYTGVTRGKRLVVLVGQKKAVAIAVRNVSGRRRWSKLAEWLSADDSKR
jgi:hypothetical protein